MKLQNGTLIKITFKQPSQYNEQNTIKHAIAVEQVTEEHPWYIDECGYHQYSIVIDNDIEYLCFHLKKKSWCMIHPVDFDFEDGTLQRVCYRKVNVQFLEETTDKFKLLPNPPGIDRFLYIREQFAKEVAKKEAAKNNNCI